MPKLTNATIALPTVDKMRDYVLEVLCRHDKLDPAQTPVAEMMLVRRDRPCGLFFQVQGPRLLKSYAIWAGEENRILFYDCAGARIGETLLCDSPDPKRLKG